MLIDEDFEVPQCPICQEYYDDSKKFPVVLECGHGLCCECLSRLREEESSKCPTCRDSIDGDKVFPKNYQLLETLSTFETVKTERKKITVQCVECQREENEQMIYACLNCTKKKFDWTVVNKEKMSKLENEETKQLDDLKNIAICANCSITNHIQNNHKITPYYNLLSTAQSSEHLANLVFLRNDYEGSVNDWKRANKTTQYLVNEGWKELDRMNDMITRGKSRVAQQKIVEKATNNTEKFTHLMEEMEQSLVEINSKFKVLLTEIAAENEKQNRHDCFENFDNMYVVEAEGAKGDFDGVGTEKGKYLKEKKKAAIAEVKIKRKMPKAYQLRKHKINGLNQP